MSEVDRVRERYDRRREIDDAWDDLDPSFFLASQEKERALVRWINGCGILPLSDKRLLDVGCGTAGDLLALVRLGFDPDNLVGFELLDHLVQRARHRLPPSVRIECGDALALPAQAASFDVVMQSTVFTSLLDDDFQRRLAQRMWELAKPGGGVLWFDFAYDNPRNRDVRGVPRDRIAELFPEGDMRCWRLWLAPPIARLATRVHPKLYTALNTVPLLRTHLLCWIEKGVRSTA